MKRLFTLIAIISTILSVTTTSCGPDQQTQATVVDSVATNIAMYKHTWDDIINHGKLDLFNDSNFTKDIVMHANPDIKGIDSARDIMLTISPASPIFNSRL
jgi:hypothetical protein